MMANEGIQDYKPLTEADFLPFTEATAIIGKIKASTPGLMLELKSSGVYAGGQALFNSEEISEVLTWLLGFVEALTITKLTAEIKEQARCRRCEHCERWTCGASVIYYCAIRPSKKTFNGLEKIKATSPACSKFEPAKESKGLFG